MARLADLMEQDRELLASIDAWDNGKPYHVAFDEDLTEAITTFDTTAAGQIRRSDRRSTPPRKSSHTLSVNPLALSVRSFRGTIRCLWQPGN
jgi:acyl-CoA reductase-like NAD-dependent aldehyde dehydrogenase